MALCAGLFTALLLAENTDASNPFPVDVSPLAMEVDAPPRRLPRRAHTRPEACPPFPTTQEDLRKPPAPSNEPGAFEALESDFQEVSACDITAPFKSVAAMHYCSCATLKGGPRC